jgi:hypothetical protein
MSAITVVGAILGAIAIAVSLWVVRESRKTHEVIRRANDVCRAAGLDSDSPAMALPRFGVRRRGDRGSTR